MRLRYLIILIFFLVSVIISSSSANGIVYLYPDAFFYNDNMNVTSASNISMDYFVIDSDYIKMDDVNLSISCTGTIVINLSQFNDTGISYRDESLIRFNATYTGSNATFTISKDNGSNKYYRLFIDGSFIEQNTGNFSYEYTSWSTHDFNITMLVYPDPPYNSQNSYNGTNNSVNLSWTSGNYTDTDVLVKKSTGYPSDPMDGTIIQNSTRTWYDFGITETAYYTVWSYNETSNTFSQTGLDLPWGALTINVFNASKTWEAVDPFGLTIQNVDGTSIYWNTTVTGGTLNLNLSDIPIGDTTIFIINATGYETQSYRRDTAQNTFMNYTFLLPPLTTSTPDAGDLDPDTGDPTNHTDSQLYLITLLNEVDQSVVDALINFSLYINATDTYEEVGSFITDGAGQGTIWLVPNLLHKVVCSVPGSDDYETNISYWTPSNILFSKTFKINYADDDIQQPYLPQDYITFTTSRTNTTLTIVYDDALEQTENTVIYVYEINTSTGVESLFHTNRTEGIDSFTVNVTGLNASNSYRIVLNYNHTVFGYQDPNRFEEAYRSALTASETFNNLMVAIFGYNPLVWSHLIMFLILVALMFFADSQDAGKILIIIGGLFLFINISLGFDDALTTAAGGIIPSLMILIGLLIEWNNRKAG